MKMLHDYPSESWMQAWRIFEIPNGYLHLSREPDGLTLDCATGIALVNTIRVYEGRYCIDYSQSYQLFNQTYDTKADADFAYDHPEGILLEQLL